MIPMTSPGSIRHTDRRSRRLALVGAEREENLSLRCLAGAAAAAGHRPEVVAFDTGDQTTAVVARLVLGGYDLVGLSVAFQHRGREFLELAAALRAAGYQGHICCGGHLATAAWADLLAFAPAVDTVIRHDGELPLVELLDLLDAPGRWGEVAGLCYRDARGEPVAAPARRQPDDLDALPHALRDRPHARHVGLGFAPVYGSRGCYGSCTYCCINAYHRSSEGKRLRFRHPARLADELAALYHDRGARIFCFHDEILFLPRPRDTLRRLEALRAELDRRGVGRVGHVGKCRPDQVDVPMLRRARELGVFRLYLGLENGSQAGLDHLGRRHTVAHNLRAVEAFAEAGLFACFNVLLFEPWTRFADLWENLELLRRAHDIPNNFCRAEVYAGSPLERMLRAEGRLRGGFLGTTYDIEDPRAELAFRLSAIAFSSRNFAPEGVANLSTGLGYEGAVLRHFYGDLGEPLAREVDTLVREINDDTIDKLSELLIFSESCDPTDAGAAVAFAEDLATRINFRDLDLGARQADLRRRIRAFGEAQGGDHPASSPPPTPGT